MMTGAKLKELAFFFDNTDRSHLEAAGLIAVGKAGDARWKRFNNDRIAFIFKLSDAERDVLAGMVNAYLKSPWVGLHPLTVQLVSEFADALASKLHVTQSKRGLTTDWTADNWQDECRRQLTVHVAKGDPLDVAAYAAFCWKHGWPTTAPESGSDTLAYPRTLSDDLREVLSLMVWQTGGLAEALRIGGEDIARKAEIEQAHVLHWLICLALENGPQYRDLVSERLRSIRQQAAAAEEAPANV